MILHAAGQTPQALFEDAAQQLFKSLSPSEDLGATLREKISLDAPSLQALLQAWITELVRLTHQEHMLFHKARILALEGPLEGSYQLHAELLGELIDPMRHTVRIDLTDRSSVMVELKTPMAGQNSLQALLQIKP